MDYNIEARPLPADITRAEFLSEMDVLLGFPQGTLTGDEKLGELEQWDSTAMLSFIALADTRKCVNVSPRKIGACATVTDLLQLAGIDRV